MIDALIQIASSLTENPEQLRLVFILLVGGAVFVCALAAISLFNVLNHPVRRRLGRLRLGAPTDGDGRLATREIDSRLNPVVPLLLPKDEDERSRMSRRLLIAGYDSPSAIVIFYAIKVALTFIAPIIALLICQHVDPNMPTNKLLLYCGGATAFGLVLPNYILGKMVDRRQKRLNNAFPDALDLLVVCIEAGLGLSPAIQRVAQELSASYPDLAHELDLVNHEIRAGAGRAEALRGLYLRTGLGDVRGLVSLLTQSLKFGTSISDTLRIYAEEFRDKRMQKAEEEAAKIGTKLIFPLIFCMFPGFFVVSVGPAFLRLAEVFSRI